jgi:DNA uptake protein ComE-like DNA-binding protein
MAAAVEISKRRETALGQIQAITGIDVERTHRDPRMAETLTLEAVADLLSGLGVTPVPSQQASPSLAEMLAQASLDELIALPGIGAATAKRIKAAQE